MFLDHYLYRSGNRKPEKCQWVRFLKNCHSKEGHSESLVLKQTAGLTFSGSSAVLQSIHGGFIAHMRKQMVVAGREECCSGLYGKAVVQHFITGRTGEHILGRYSIIGEHDIVIKIVGLYPRGERTR